MSAETVKPKPSPAQIRAGGGVYVYRTRKPSSFLGLLHAKLETPWWLFAVGAAAACAVNLAIGSPWWIGLSVLLTSGRHFGYVGETVSFRDRHGEHVNGGGRWKRGAQPWSDLDPVCVLRLPMPKWKWLLHATETLFMFLCAPVYNEKKNKWNPRRITLASARRMRKRRNRRRVKLNLPNIRAAHIVAIFVLLVFLNANGAF